MVLRANKVAGFMCRYCGALNRSVLERHVVKKDVVRFADFFEILYGDEEELDDEVVKIIMPCCRKEWYFTADGLLVEFVKLADFVILTDWTAAGTSDKALLFGYFLVI